MIGIFDSGFWGLQTLKYFKEKYPQYDYLFLADNLNVPYGEKSANEIREMTFRGLNWLFDNGAELVILACNTAASYSIRPWQNEFPNKKVLSVTIPWIEKIKELWCKNVGALVTRATFESWIYSDLCANILNWEPCKLELVVASDIVFAIEKLSLVRDERQKIIKKYLNQFKTKKDCLILGCTHYPIWMEDFKFLFRWKIYVKNRWIFVETSWYIFKNFETMKI